MRFDPDTLTCEEHNWSLVLTFQVSNTSTIKYRSLSAAVTKEDSALLSRISILGFSVPANTWSRSRAFRPAEDTGKDLTTKICREVKISASLRVWQFFNCTFDFPAPNKRVLLEKLTLAQLTKIFLLRIRASQVAQTLPILIFCCLSQTRQATMQSEAAAGFFATWVTLLTLKLTRIFNDKS